MKNFVLIVMVVVSGSNGVYQDTKSSCLNRNLPIVSVINNIGARLSQEMVNKGNMLFSPYGLSMTLGMAYMAARGRTAHQMEKALGLQAYNMSNEKFQRGMLQLSENVMQHSADEATLKLANALFNQVGMQIPQQYRKEVFRIYGSLIHAVDFAKDPVRVMSTINDWASRKTANRIKNFLSDPLPSASEILLANVLYFKGTWKVQFPLSETYRGYFYSRDGRDAVVNMMAISMERFLYFKDAVTGYKFLELPYKGGEIVMLLALPSDFDQSPDLAMTADLLCRINASLSYTKLERVSIPRFRFEFGQSMKDSLYDMGMKDAFQSGVANFTNMRKNVHISDIRQKTVLEVNEEGSELAAVTGILIVPVSFREVDEFVANHPFSFHIMHKKSGLVLFTGKITSI